MTSRGIFVSVGGEGRRPTGAAILVAACLVVVAPHGGESSSACVETYETAFKAKKGNKVSPKDVAGLYNTWCKDNMRVSSAKSMDELCAPLVRKVEDKMVWVPPETAVTPEIACESVDRLKERFPTYVSVAEAKMKNVGAEDSKKKELFNTAKKLKAKLDAELRAVTSAFSKSLVEEMTSKLRAGAIEVLGAEAAAEKPSEDLIKTVTEAATLNVRGTETKLLQKMEEALGAWTGATAKLAAAKAKAEL